MIFLEAGDMERSVALLTLLDCLPLLLPLQVALLAVAPHGLAITAILSVDNPVVNVVIPDSQEAVFLGSTGHGGLAMFLQHEDHQLTQEVKVGLLLPCDFHAEPPGIHSTDTEGPGVEGEPPLLGPDLYPVAGNHHVLKINTALVGVVLGHHVWDGDNHLINAVLPLS